MPANTTIDSNARNSWRVACRIPALVSKISKRIFAHDDASQQRFRVSDWLFLTTTTTAVAVANPNASTISVHPCMRFDRALSLQNVGTGFVRFIPSVVGEDNGGRRADRRQRLYSGRRVSGRLAMFFFIAAVFIHSFILRL